VQLAEARFFRFLSIDVGVGGEVATYYNLLRLFNREKTGKRNEKGKLHIDRCS
jgi:hypothetical protein